MFSIQTKTRTRTGGRAYHTRDAGIKHFSDATSDQAVEGGEVHFTIVRP